MSESAVHLLLLGLLRVLRLLLHHRLLRVLRLLLHHHRLLRVLRLLQHHWLLRVLRLHLHLVLLLVLVLLLLLPAGHDSAAICAHLSLHPHGLHILDCRPVQHHSLLRSRGARQLVVNLRCHACRSCQVHDVAARPHITDGGRGGGGVSGRRNSWGGSWRALTR